MRNVATALFLAAYLATSCASRASRPAEPTTPSDEWEEMSLADQKRVFLVEQHIASAQRLRQEMRNDEARTALLRALELDPGNAEAQRILSEIDNGVMPEAVASSASADEGMDQEEDGSDEMGMREAQVVQDVRDELRKAKVLLARGDYDGAIAELTLAQDMIQFAPPSIDWEGAGDEVSKLLASSRATRQSQETASVDEARRRTREELMQQENIEKERRERVVANLTNKALTAFRDQRYEEAIEYADQVLRLEPRNERALDVRDTAFRAGREKVHADYLRNKREQYLRWQEDVAELRVPYNQIVTLPDEDFWHKITEARASRRGIDLTHDMSESELRLRGRLADTRIPGLQISDEESLTVVIDTLRAVTGLPLIVDPAAEEAAVDEGAVFELALTNSMPVDKVLNLVTDIAGESVTWTVKHDAVLVTTKEKARGELVIVNHDVQDLIFGLTDFLGPRIDRLRLVDDLEDDDGGGLFGGLGEKPTINEPDDLETLVRENVAVTTWDEEGISITIEGGNMVVVQTAEVQNQVRQFLGDLRRFSSSLVTIESKFMTIADNFIQEIGVEWRGLDNPGDPFTDLDDVGLDSTLGLDNGGNPNTPVAPSAGFFFDDGAAGDVKARTEHIFGSALGSALTTFGGLTAQYTFLDDIQASLILRLTEKNQNIELINDQVLSVHNTQRAFVTVINQRAYVQDFDVNVAQFVAVADPVINVLTEGIVLDVRPTIHHSRKQITLEIQPTVATVVSLTNFSTSLAGQTQPVTFQLPELQVQSVFTTAVVPDGGTILIGGLSRLRNVERRAEVPWIANLPIVGFFFKEEGYNDEKESLMIMIRAWITDVKEELAALER